MVTDELVAPPATDLVSTLVIDDQGVIWFTLYVGNRIGRLDRRTGAITEFETAGRPYGIALDRAGHVWFCQIGAHKLGKLDPKTGAITELALERGSRPRRMATAPDGSLWVTLYGAGALLRVDPIAGKVVQEYVLPAQPLSDPYAVTVDGGGVWCGPTSSRPTRSCAWTPGPTRCGCSRCPLKVSASAR